MCYLVNVVHTKGGYIFVYKKLLVDGSILALLVVTTCLSNAGKKLVVGLFCLNLLSLSNLILLLLGCI